MKVFGVVVIIISANEVRKSRVAKTAPESVFRELLTQAGFSPGISYDKDYLGLVGRAWPGRRSAIFPFPSPLSLARYLSFSHARALPMRASAGLRTLFRRPS